MSIAQSHAQLTVQVTALTFIGNARSGLQQDAFAIGGDYYQTDLGMTPIETIPDAFCVAVADGLGMSDKSQHASSLVAEVIAEQWRAFMDTQSLDQFETQPPFDLIALHQRVCQAPKTYTGAGSTLALVYRLPNDPNKLTIKHVGDSRVYLHRLDHDETDPSSDGNLNEGKANGWRCLTVDHNVMNAMVLEQAMQTGVTPNPQDFNKEGMAGSLYAITECYIIDHEMTHEPAPKHASQTLTIQAGDAILVCSDGIHDLVPCSEWQEVTQYTDLQKWLKTLKRQVYASQGNAYDNGTAVLVRF